MAIKVARVDAELLSLAEKQMGAISRKQALALGLTRHAINHRLVTGRWLRVHEGVYRVAGVPVTRDLLMHAALLWAEPAVLSHRSAASVWGFEGFAFKLEIIVATNLRSRSGVTVHRRCLEPDEVRTVRGLTVISPELTILDLCTLDRRQAEVAFDKGLRKRLYTLCSVSALLERRNGKGHAGCALLRSFIQERQQESGSVQSALERKTLSVIRKHGLPLPVAQHPITDGWGMTFHADFAYPDHRLAIECEGYEFHSGGHEWDRDLWNLVTLTSYRVLHVTHRRLVDDEAGFIQELRKALSTGPSSSGT